MTYDLSHLTQTDLRQLGPIQDDDALLLFALLRTIEARTILEFGFLSGYSSTNFLKALGNRGRLYSVDREPFEPLADNHTAIIKDCAAVVSEDVDSQPLDLIFLDCHNHGQLHAINNLSSCITESTIIAAHDTGYHNHQAFDWSYKTEYGWAHQECERRIVNQLQRDGWQAVCLHPPKSRIGLRHGLTLLRQFKPLP